MPGLCRCIIIILFDGLWWRQDMDSVAYSYRDVLLAPCNAALTRWPAWKGKRLGNLGCGRGC